MSLFDDTIDIEMAFDVEFGARENVNVFCPFHEDEATSFSKSCSVNVNGFYKCHVCNATGTAVDFYAKVVGLDRAGAEKRLQESLADPAKKVERERRQKITAVYETATSQPLRQSLAQECHTDLMRPGCEQALDYLRTKRGLTIRTLKKYLIGHDEYRITIPIFDALHQLVNIRRYKPNAGSQSKILTHAKGDGTPRLYPLNVLSELVSGDELIVCEGEWDCLLLNQMGLPAITNTGNVKAWSLEWTQQLHDYRLVFIFDVHDKEDDLGQRVARERVKHVFSAGTEAKRVELPLPEKYVGGDITDYIVNEKHTSKELRKLINDTPWYGTKSITEPAAEMPTPVATSVKRPPTISLEEAANAKYYYKTIHMRCLVAGKGVAPFILPKTVDVEAILPNGTSMTYSKTFDVKDGTIVAFAGASETKQTAIIRQALDLPGKTKLKYTILETINLEEIFLIPTVGDRQEGDSESGAYTLRHCFYVGIGLETNRVYDFEGYTLPNPNTQQATHLLLHARPAETNIDSFKMTDELYKELASTFQCTNIADKLGEIASEMSMHVTGIVGREDLHIAIDLVFHSVLYFDFAGDRVKKGWLEALVLGDTRTGKGFVTEGLCKHYRVGEVISGENVTLAGLVGSVQKLGDRWTLVWGKIPLADRRLIVMDEASSLSHGTIGKLSRIRSEGIAEVTKVISQKTNARTRLIWLANPRSGKDSMPRMIADYNYGIEAVPELIGAAEDVARFDFVLIVAQNEVSSDEINSARAKKGDRIYTSDLCHKLIMWAWSRKPEDVVFSDDIPETVLKAAKALGRMFSPKICLIQSEDVRFKLLRIACAAAARTFSTKDGEKLLVKKEHIGYAYNFLYHIYSKPSNGYVQLSETERERSTLRDPLAVHDILRQAGEALPDLVNGFLEHRMISARDLADYAGMDIFQARSLVSELVRQRAIIKEYGGYAKKPAFKAFLHKLRAQFTEDEATTQPDEEHTNE